MCRPVAQSRKVVQAMEFILQYLDDLDDAFGTMGLAWESLRRGFVRIASAALLTGIAAAGISLALLHQPIALATSTILFVILLYRVVTAPVLKLSA